MLTQYTSYDDIRAAIGVAEEEITDSVLELHTYELVLEFDLSDIGAFVPTIQQHFLDLTNTTTTPTPSVDEERFISMLQVYAAYVIARHLLMTLKMFAPQTIKDSKTEIVRDDPYEDTKVGVEIFYQQMRARVLAAYLVLYPATVVSQTFSLVPLIAVGLALDPVTGV